MFKDFHAKGLSVIPLRNGIPTLPWSCYNDSIPGDEAMGWDENEYALVCGKVSNVIAVDIDINDTTQIESLAGISPVKKFGSKGFTAFYRYNGESNHVWKLNGNVVCELMAWKKLTTIPPSPHRTTKTPYVWFDKGLLDDVELPFLNPDFILFMDAKYPSPPQKLYTSYPSLNESLTFSDTAEMLEFVSSDCARDEWVQIGMALQSEWGDAANTLWHNWSAKSTKYDSRAAQSAWRSFHNGGVTIGTLIHFAKQGGWQRTTETIESGYDVDMSYLFHKPKPEQVKAVIDDIKAHGLVGEIADWMTRTAWKPQPLLSLSAALTFVGFLKGRKYVTETDVYSNIYAFNIAGTACGKDRPQAAIKHIMARLQATDRLLHAPASGAGYIDSLYAAGGHAITTIDEMADYIAGASNKQSGSHQKKVLKYWMEAFTSPHTFVDGERRADAAKEKAKRVDNPLFCLLGSTNPNSLRISLSGEEIGNGLLNRFLFFASSTSPRKRKSREFNRNEQLSEWCIATMEAYLSPNHTDNYGTQASLTKVPFTDEAFDLFDSIDDFYEDECAKLDSNDRLRSLYGRAHEYVAKVALILSDDIKITKQDVEVAHSIVSLSVATAVDFCGDITDTKEENDYVKVKQIIRKAGVIKMSKLSTISQFVNQKRRDEIVNSLHADDFINIEKTETKGRPAYTITWIQK